jgi:hypothetical protein
MPLYSLPKPNSLLDSVNKSYLQYYKELIGQVSKETEENTTIKTGEIKGKTNAGAIQGSEPACKKYTNYENLPFVDLKTTKLSEYELKELIKNTTIDEKLKPLYYGVIKTKYLNTNDGEIWECPNYNLYNIGAYNSGYSPTLISKVQNQFCARTSLLNEDASYPFFNFNNFNESLDFYNSVVKGYKEVINLLTEKSNETTDAKKHAHAYTVFTLFWDQGRYYDPEGGVGVYRKEANSYGDFNTRFIEKVKEGNEPIYTDYQNYFKIFEDSYKTFFP